MRVQGFPVTGFTAFTPPVKQKVFPASGPEASATARALRDEAKPPPRELLDPVAASGEAPVDAAGQGLLEALDRGDLLGAQGLELLQGLVARVNEHLRPLAGELGDVEGGEEAVQGRLPGLGNVLDDLLRQLVLHPLEGQELLVDKRVEILGIRDGAGPDEGLDPLLAEGVDLDLDAWEAYHRGLWHFLNQEPNENQQAKVFFQRATDLDSGFAAGYYALALCDVWDGWVYASRPMEDCVGIARPLAQRALALDDAD